MTTEPETQDTPGICVNYNAEDVECQPCDKRNPACVLYNDGTPCDVRTRRVKEETK